jgi:hypothetical protein
MCCHDETVTTRTFEAVVDEEAAGASGGARSAR